jgi:hypothetical protein
LDLDSPSLSELIARSAGTTRTDVLDAVIRRLQPLVAGVVGRTLRRHGVCDAELVKDLSQETFLKLLGDKFNLKERTRGRTEGEIFGLVKATTANLVLDAMRTFKPAVPIDDVVVVDDSNKKLETQVVVQEVDAILKGLLSPPNVARDYRIFWFYHRDRMTAREITLIPGMDLTVKGVESVVFRLTAEVKAAIARPKGISAKGAF